MLNDGEPLCICGHEMWHHQRLGQPDTYRINCSIYDCDCPEFQLHVKGGVNRRVRHGEHISPEERRVAPGWE